MLVINKLLKNDDPQDNSTVLACFSPQVMILTFVLEMILMLYVFVKHSARSVVLKLVLLELFFLALFQLSEYSVCEGFLFDPNIWSRIGFASITLLPPLGVHMVQALRKDKSMMLSQISYALCAVFVATFLVFDSFSGAVCTGNYVIFSLRPLLGGAFMIYYYMLLLLAAILAVRGYGAVKSQSTKKALLGIVVGYAAFVVPATLIHLFYESAASGLPSIMCGFALIFAFILGLYVSKHVPSVDK